MHAYAHVHMHAVISGYMSPHVTMHSHAQNLIGEHDFTSFRGAGCQSDSPNRRINHCLVKRIGDLIVLDIEANAFLLHMVRNIASCLSQITEDMPADYLMEVLNHKDRSKIGMTAPSSGLYFYKVYNQAFYLQL